jgi:hypothetical protein
MWIVDRSQKVEFLQCCGIWDIYPGSRILIFYPSRISHLTTARKDEGKYFLFYYTVPVVFYYILPKKLPLSSKKYGFGIQDPGSGEPEKSNSGSRIRISNTKKNILKVDTVM